MTATRKPAASPKRRVSKTYVTVAEVCEELGISRSTFYDWRTGRKAPSCLKLPNGDLRIRRRDYDDWLSTLSEEAA